MASARVLAAGGVGLALAIGTAVLLFREPDVSLLRVETLADLDRELEALRVRLRIPGMSAAIADDGQRWIWPTGASRSRWTKDGC